MKPFPSSNTNYGVDSFAMSHMYFYILIYTDTEILSICGMCSLLTEALCQLFIYTLIPDDKFMNNDS